MNMELIHVFIQHTDYEITVGKMSRFIYEF